MPFPNALLESDIKKVITEFGTEVMSLDGDQTSSDVQHTTCTNRSSSLVFQTGGRKQRKQCLNQRKVSNLPPSLKKVLGASSSVANSQLSFYDGCAMGYLAEASAVCSLGGSVVHATFCSAKNSNQE